MRCDHRLFVYQLTQNDKVAAKLYNNYFGKNVNKSEATSSNGNQYVKTWKNESHRHLLHLLLDDDSID